MNSMLNYRQPTGVPNAPTLKPPQANAGMGPQPQLGKPMGFVAPGQPITNANGVTRMAGAVPAGAKAFGAPSAQALPNGPVQSLQGNTNGQLPGGIAPPNPEMNRFQTSGGIAPPNPGMPPLQIQQHQQQSKSPLPGQPMGYGQPQAGGLPPTLNTRIMGANGQMPNIGAPAPRPVQNTQVAPPPQAQPMGFPGQPTISTGPVYSQQQQDQLINQAIGQNAMQADTQARNVMNRVGASGFAAGGSPAAQAMQNQTRVAQMQADNAARTGIPLQLAQTNAQHLLNSQQAAEGQYSNRMNERLTGQGQQLGFLSNLMGSLLTY